MSVLPYGPAAWLVELDERDVAGFARAVVRARHAAITEVVPGAQSVLVRARSDEPDGGIRAWLAQLLPEPPADRPDETVEIPVTYDGADLAAVAEATGCSVEVVVSRHHQATYVCAFCGFAPGFAYLRGLDPALVLPRRTTPRTRVPAGAVAIADRYSAVYPSGSPGGWHVIGHTDAPLWDARREPPALIAPGAAVRFVPR
jgi:KipI family sensor histidine kinase inhibitor